MSTKNNNNNLPTNKKEDKRKSDETKEEDEELADLLKEFCYLLRTGGGGRNRSEEDLAELKEKLELSKSVAASMMRTQFIVENAIAKFGECGVMHLAVIYALNHIKQVNISNVAISCDGKVRSQYPFVALLLHDLVAMKKDIGGRSSTSKKDIVYMDELAREFSHHTFLWTLHETMMHFKYQRRELTKKSLTLVFLFHCNFSMLMICLW